MVLADDVTADSREAEAAGWSMRAKVAASLVALYVLLTFAGLDWANGWQPHGFVPMFPLLMAFEFRLSVWCERLLPVALVRSAVLTCCCDVSYVVFL